MKEKYQLYVTKPQLRWLREESKRTGLSVAELVRRAIDKYRKEYEY